MSGAAIGILGYTKNIYLGTPSSLASSMFTVKGNGLSARVCQPATANNYELDSKQQLITNKIRPLLSHGISLPQIPWQQPSYRNQLLVPASSSRNKSANLISPPRESLVDVDRVKPSSFPNFRIAEKLTSGFSRFKEDEIEKEQLVDSFRPTSSLEYRDFLKSDDKSVDFKTRSDGTDFLSTKDAYNNSTSSSRSAKSYQRKKRTKFHKINGRKSRCRNKKEHKRGKIQTQFRNSREDAINSNNIPFSKHPVLQVQPVSKHKTNKDGSGDCRQISQKKSNSSTKSFSLSSSHNTLCSEIFQRASTIYSNLKKSCQEKEGEEKVRRVYLSEKQSGIIKDCGVMLPCAPPCTPTVEQLKKVEYVLSMNDIRSQRAVKERLSQIENKAKRKELARKEEAKKTEKQYLKDQELLKKQRQRLEIYALNKIMTELEEKNFQQFCKIMKSDSTSTKNN